MIEKLRALKSLIARDLSSPAHAELEHAHWDPDARTWRVHAEPTTEKDAA